MRAIPLLVLAALALRADDRTARIENIFAAFDQPGSPGCAVGVVHHGKLVFGRGYGYANLEHGVPLTTRSIFDIASTSKQFVAFATLLLEQDGGLSLDQPVRKWIPELPPYASSVTIRHLLEHTSGLRDYLTLARLKGLSLSDYYSGADVLAWLARQNELNFAPGSDWLYSNSGYFLMSQVIQRASGKSLRDYAHERIFAPLGMKSSRFHDDHTELVPLRASAYAPRPGSFRISMSPLDLVGDGGLYTNVEDLALWDANFYTAKVGGESLLRRLQQPARLDGGKQLDYALGLMLDTWNGRPAVFHGGSWAGYRAELFRLPNERFSVICLCNVLSADAAALARRVAEVWFPPAPGSTPQPPAVTLSEEQLRRWEGDWREELTGAVWKLAVNGGKLTGTHPIGPVRLTPLSEREFKIDGVPMPARIAFDSRTARLFMGNFPAVNLARVIPVALTREDLAAFAGRYWSSELEVHYDIALDNGKLIVRAPRQEPLPLLPAEPDLFTSRGLEFQFQRGSSGAVSSFRLAAGRVRNLLFTKTP